MKKKVIKLFEKRIEELYTESRNLLLKSSSYNVNNVNFKNVHLFLSFVENTLEKPYNRLRTISVFVNDPDDLRTDIMYPFAMLTDQVKNSIGHKEAESVKLANALDVGEINDNYKALWKEKI